MAAQQAVTSQGGTPPPLSTSDEDDIAKGLPAIKRAFPKLARFFVAFDEYEERVERISTLEADKTNLPLIHPRSLRRFEKPCRQGQWKGRRAVTFRERSSKPTASPELHLTSCYSVEIEISSARTTAF
jgi:hypothetical protein